MGPEMDWARGLSRTGDAKERQQLADGGALVSRVLAAHGVKYVFAINGGHTWPILASLRENGIAMIHMRHEQACAFAADGYARSLGRVGVCSVTAGCGLTNALTGLCTANAAGSAVVCIAGQHPTTEDGLGSFQEAYGAEICKSFCKFTKRVLDWTAIEIDVREALRQAISPPQGAALVEIPVNVLYHADDPGRQRRGAQVFAPDELRSAADPARIERALEMLRAAERPLIVGGDGVFWSGAAPELQALVEYTGIPAYCRRAGQGALPEDHALAVRGSWKKSFTGRADAILVVGFKFWSGEHFGEAPTWNEKARYIQIDAVPTQLGRHVPVDLAIVGDPKAVLRQMVETAKRMGLDFSRHRNSPWAQEVAQVRQRFERDLDELENRVRAQQPVHPAHLVRELCRVADRDATVVIDSFTLSGWIRHAFAARFPGQLLDAGPLAPVGHSVGMAIGAQLARPGKQVIAVIGDGGFGIGGWDMETALRYRLPVVAVLWNNSSWGPSFEQLPLLQGRTEPFSMLPGIRYDRMFEVLGCHAEHVEGPEQVRPALERALSAGRAAVVNVVGDPLVGHPALGGNLLGSTRARG